MSLSQGQLAALSELEQLWPEANAVVIGASALGFYYDVSWRHTTDVDLVVALTVDVLPALANRPGWRRHPKREYEFTSPGGARVDLIPAYVKEDDGRRWDETPDDIDFDLAPAFLLGSDVAGSDVARLFSHDEHRRVVDSFLRQVEAPTPRLIS